MAVINLCHLPDYHKLMEMDTMMKLLRGQGVTIRAPGNRNDYKTS